MKNVNRRTFLQESAGLLMGGVCLAAPVPPSEIEPETGTFPSFLWPSEPPAACPLPQSRTFSGLRFQGRYARYAHADTWYPSWAGEDRLYSPWTDGRVGSIASNSAGPNATTGQAVISGDDPLRLKISDVRIHKASPVPYGGRYPCGSLMHNGVWYYGTYCLMDSDGDPGKGLNWDILGPFVGFRHSTDFGKTWQDCPHTPLHPLFAEPKEPGKTVRFGAPHFVDFGRNMQHSPDGKHIWSRMVPRCPIQRLVPLTQVGSRETKSGWRASRPLRPTSTTRPNMNSSATTTGVAGRCGHPNSNACGRCSIGTIITAASRLPTLHR